MNRSMHHLEEPMNNRETLNGLCEYLNNSKEEIVSLTFSEIETIIGHSLPAKACSSRWWYNNCRNTHANSWLSSGYKTFDTKNIPSRKGVCFQKQSKTGIDKYIYNKVLVNCAIYIILPIVTAVLASIIFLTISSHIERIELIENTLQTIEMYYSAQEYESVDVLIYDLLPEVKKEKDYTLLCHLYDYLCKIKYFESTVQGDPLSSNQISNISEICKSGLDYAITAQDKTYQILFNLSLGKLYKYQYEKTLDLSHAFSALDYFRSSEKLFEEEYLEVLSHDGMHKAMLGLETYLSSYEVLEALIENGTYHIDDNLFVSDQKYEPTLENVISQMLYYAVDISATSISISSQIEIHNTLSKCTESPEEISFNQYESFDTEIFLRSNNVYARYNALMYLLCSKYDVTSIAGIEPLQYEEVIEHLIRTEASAKANHSIEILSTTYFDIARASYHSYVYENNLTALITFEKYLDLWLELTDQNELTLQDRDRYFFTIVNGELLDHYIDEIECILERSTFSENPSFYAYCNWDLAKHYMYKAQELALDDSSLQKLALEKVVQRCNTALIYFSDDTHYKVHFEIELLLDAATSQLDRMK